MSRSAASTRQVHTTLGGGMRYETAELLLSAIPNFELKQKGRILQLFEEVRNYRAHRQFRKHADDRFDSCLDPCSAWCHKDSINRQLGTRDFIDETWVYANALILV